MVEPRLDDERLGRAEALLQEAVYRSRASQAAEGLFAKGADEPGGCGLGARAAVVLDLSDEGRELFDALFAELDDERRLEEMRAVLADWVRRQDALDRKRNHFLKDFRRTHGFDRAEYSPEVATEYRAGLDRVNAEVDAARREAAERLLRAATSVG